MKIVVALLSLAALSDAFCNPDSRNVEVKLKNDILCHYNKEERPKQPRLPVELNYVVQGFEFTEDKSELEVQARILHRWDDLRLKWDEAQYEGIQIIHVSSDSVWVPQLFFNDSHHHYGIGDCHQTECLIKSSGQVGCRFPCVQRVACDADYFDWPFDAHECRAVFRTFFEYEEVEFDPNQLNGFILRNYNNEWKLNAVEGSINLKEKSSVNFVFRIQRFSGTLFKHVVVPGYVLITFSLLILWMEPRNAWRVIFCGVNIYLHFSLMDRIWWQFPTNGVSRNVPRILKYMIFMLILPTVILIESIIFRVSSIYYSTPPIWIQKIVGSIEESTVLKHFVYSFTDVNVAVKVEEVKVVEKTQSDDGTEEISVVEEKVIKTDEKIDPNTRTWSIFYRLIDRLVFIGFTISYAIYDGY